MKTSGQCALFHGYGFVHVALGSRTAGLHALPLHKLVVPLAEATLSCAYAGRRFQTQSPILVAANVTQAMFSSGPTIAVFVPALADGMAVVADAPLQLVSGRERERVQRAACALLHEASPARALEAIATVGNVLLARRRLDRRVQAAVGSLEAAAPGTRPALEHLAAAAQLSASRFSHLFASNTGISLRSWLSFQRVYRAVQKLAQERNLASLAAENGYADQPHFTRDVRRHFGRTPATIGSVLIQDAGSALR